MSATEGVSIRALHASDYPLWADLWRAYLEFYETKLPADVYRSSFDRMLSNDEREFHGLVAERNGALIGLAHYLFHRHGWKVENVCYLQDLFVMPSERGTGLGRALIEAVYARADEAGSPHVYWNTQESNATARILYDHIGVQTEFIEYERSKDL